MDSVVVFLLFSLVLVSGVFVAVAFPVQVPVPVYAPGELVLSCECVAEPQEQADYQKTLETVHKANTTMTSITIANNTRLDRSIARSLALAKERSFAYNFSCGYEIDGILIHEGLPRYGQKWWGFATKDRIVIKQGLSPEQRMMVFAHEFMHYNRMQNGDFNSKDLKEEERLAYLYGWNESNWDERINRFFCVEDEFDE